MEGKKQGHRPGVPANHVPLTAWRCGSDGYQAGIPVKLDLYDGMWHGFQVLNPDLSESKLARRKVADFLNEYLV
jgi:hypothetical protein